MDTAIHDQRVARGERFSDAIALYLNLDLKITPRSGPPETELIRRGDADAGLSFLPEGKAFAIGVAPVTFERFANIRIGSSARLSGDRSKRRQLLSAVRSGPDGDQ